MSLVRVSPKKILLLALVATVVVLLFSRIPVTLDDRQLQSRPAPALPQSGVRAESDQRGRLWLAGVPSRRIAFNFLQVGMNFDGGPGSPAFAASWQPSRQRPLIESSWDRDGAQVADVINPGGLDQFKPLAVREARVSMLGIIYHTEFYFAKSQIRQWVRVGDAWPLLAGLLCTGIVLSIVNTWRSSRVRLNPQIAPSALGASDDNPSSVVVTAQTCSECRFGESRAIDIWCPRNGQFKPRGDTCEQFEGRSS